MVNTYGWVGKILRVDLSSSNISEIETGTYAEHIGGIGIGARLGWEELSPGTRALGLENKLFFMTGPLGGVPMVAGAGRANLCGISPHTFPKEQFTYSSMGGDWPVELKFAGYDGLVVQGKANRPVYLWVSNDDIQIRDAEDLWGLDTFERIFQNNVQRLRYLTVWN